MVFLWSQVRAVIDAVSKTFQSMRLKAFILVAVAAVLPEVHAGEIPTPNNFGGNFTFNSTLDGPVSIERWKGKLVLLNFGFTSCPDVCPMVLSKLALVQKELDDESERIQVVFVTVDPERDDIEKLTSYLKHFHGSFVGMRPGSEAELADVLKRYGAALEATRSEQGTSISHSDYVYVINQDGYVSGYYDIKADTQELLASVEKLLPFRFSDLF